jgi:hypothetical protein
MRFARELRLHRGFLMRAGPGGKTPGTGLLREAAAVATGQRPIAGFEPAVGGGEREAQPSGELVGGWRGVVPGPAAWLAGSGVSCCRSLSDGKGGL